MTRHPGHVFDINARTVRGRDGITVYPLESLVVAGDALYAAYFPTEHPRIERLEQWLLAGQGWNFNRFTVRPSQKPPVHDWYIDIDQTERTGNRWWQRDCLLDVSVHEGRFYVVEDADELADALEAGEISLQEANAALRALQQLCHALPLHGLSGAAVLSAFAPGLPVEGRSAG